MTIDEIVNYTNARLAGEQLTFGQLTVHLDSVIDDINFELDSKFPVFSEFERDQANYPDYPNYNFFPDKYIRSVVTLGAAYKFFITDEEGIQTAQEYGYQYDDAMFRMVRDYSSQVPVDYQNDNQGYLEGCGITALNSDAAQDCIVDAFLI